MEWIGYILAVLIGISLGLIGGGGSVLTVPLLVYAFGIAPQQATSYSLFIVGVTSFFGVLYKSKLGAVNFRLGLLFGLASIVTVFMTRHFFVPHIPKVLFYVGRFGITKNTATMVLFALLMLFSAYSMIRSEHTETNEPIKKVPMPTLVLSGIGIGLITGLLGAGGGFLIIPSLVLLYNLPMKNAIGTSLFIIAMNAMIGFFGDLGHYIIDWQFLFTITPLALVGLVAGHYLSKQFNSEELRKAFGWFVLITGIFILLKEFFG